MGALRSNVMVSLGLVSFPVSVQSAVSGAPQASLFCEGTGTDKTHPALVKTTQTLHCPHCENQARASFVRAMDIGGGEFVKLPDDLFDEVDESIKNGIRLECHPAREVEESTLPGEKFYFLNPSRTGGTAYAMMVDAVRRRSDTAFVAKFAVRGVEAFYRLGVLKNALVLKELARPETVLAAPDVSTDFDQALAGLLDAAIDATTTPFVEANYADPRTAKLNEFLTAHRDQGQVAATAAKGAVAPVLDLSAALAQMVKASAPAPGKAPKRAPAKKAAKAAPRRQRAKTA